MISNVSYLKKLFLKLALDNKLFYCSLYASILRIVPGRVRVAVRLRPRIAEESVGDADFADCVELQPEVLFN
jgi:hypothetical protein